MDEALTVGAMPRRWASLWQKMTQKIILIAMQLTCIPSRSSHNPTWCCSSCKTAVFGLSNDGLCSRLGRFMLRILLYESYE